MLYYATHAQAQAIVDLRVIAPNPVQTCSNNVTIIAENPNNQQRPIIIFYGFKQNRPPNDYYDPGDAVRRRTCFATAYAGTMVPSRNPFSYSATPDLIGAHHEMVAGIFANGDIGITNVTYREHVPCPPSIDNTVVFLPDLHLNNENLSITWRGRTNYSAFHARAALQKVRSDISHGNRIRTFFLGDTVHADIGGIAGFRYTDNFFNNEFPNFNFTSDNGKIAFAMGNHDFAPDWTPYVEQILPRVPHVAYGKGYQFNLDDWGTNPNFNFVTTDSSAGTSSVGRYGTLKINQMRNVLNQTTAGHIIMGIHHWVDEDCHLNHNNINCMLNSAQSPEVNNFNELLNGFNNKDFVILQAHGHFSMPPVVIGNQIYKKTNSPWYSDTTDAREGFTTVEIIGDDELKITDHYLSSRPADVYFINLPHHGSFGVPSGGNNNPPLTRQIEIDLTNLGINEINQPNYTLTVQTFAPAATPSVNVHTSSMDINAAVAPAESLKNEESYSLNLVTDRQTLDKNTVKLMISNVPANSPVVVSVSRGVKHLEKYLPRETHTDACGVIHANSHATQALKVNFTPLRKKK